MTYKAKLSSVEAQSVANDTVNVNVVYYDEKGKEFTKSYNFHASNFKDTQAVQDFIRSECETLDSFNAMVEILKPLIGIEDITGKLAEIDPVTGLGK